MNIKQYLGKRGLPEANVQAEFYLHARMTGLNCVLELSTPVGRVDIAVLDAQGEHLKAVVECKRHPSKKRRTWQMEKYRKLGVPVYELDHIGEAEPLVRLLGSAKKWVHVPLEDVLTLPRLTRKRKSKEEKIQMTINNLDPDINFRY